MWLCLPVPLRDILVLGQADATSYVLANTVTRENRQLVGSYSLEFEDDGAAMVVGEGLDGTSHSSYAKIYENSSSPNIAVVV